MGARLSQPLLVLSVTMRILVGGLVFCFLSSGCGLNRVTLPPVPEKTAPLPERVRAYKELQPQHAVLGNYSKEGVHVSSTIDSILLANGVRVEDPRDLLPAMEPEDAASNFARGYEEKWSRGRTLSVVGGGVGVLGIVVAFVPLANPDAFRSADGRSSATTASMIGLGVLALSAIPFYFSRRAFEDAERDRISAFQTYPESLRKRLAIHEDAARGSTVPPRQQVNRDVPEDLPLQVTLLP